MPASADAAPGERGPDLIVIPARFGSTRLPGKPLIEIAGRSLLSRVVDIGRRAATLAGDAELLVATDDERVTAHAAKLGCAVAMTAADIASGSGRACAAMRQRASHSAIIVNLQGDAPFVPAAVVAALLVALRTSDLDVATPVTRLSWPDLDRLRAHKRDAPASGTTVTRAADGRALWFSKAIIPQIRDEAARRECEETSPVFRHLGVYAYRADALARFEALPVGSYEAIEGLEQLRFLENGIDILTVAVPAPRHPISGIDSPADVTLAERLIAELGDPFGG